MEQHNSPKLWEWSSSFRTGIKKKVGDWSGNVSIASWDGAKTVKVLLFNSMFGHET